MEEVELEKDNRKDLCYCVGARRSLPPIFRPTKIVTIIGDMERNGPVFIPETTTKKKKEKEKAEKEKEGRKGNINLPDLACSQIEISSHFC